MFCKCGHMGGYFMSVVVCRGVLRVSVSVRVGESSFFSLFYCLTQL